MTQDSASKGTTDAGRRLVTTRREADTLAIILMFVFATSAICLSLPPVVQNDLIRHVGLDNGQYGLLMTVFLAFYGVSGFSSGIIAARWGGRLLGVCCGCFFLQNGIGASSLYPLNYGLPLLFLYNNWENPAGQMDRQGNVSATFT